MPVGVYLTGKSAWSSSDNYLFGWPIFCYKVIELSKDHVALWTIFLTSHTD